MTGGQPPRSRPLSITEGVLVILIGVFSKQLADILRLPPYVLVALFCVLLASLILVRIYLGALPPSPSAHDESPKTAPRGAVGLAQRARVNYEDLVFPLGLVTGLCITVPTYLVVSRFWVVTVYAARGYELAAAGIGFVLCAALQLSARMRGAEYFALGVGLGQGSAVMMLAPQESNLFSTLLFTPLAYLTFSLTIRVGPGRWRFLLALPSFLLVLLLANVSMALLLSSAQETDMFSQAGTIELYAPGRHVVHYESPFSSVPFLDVHLNGMNPDSVRFRVIRQDSASFEIEVARSYHYPVSLFFQARGRQSPATK